MPCRLPDQLYQLVAPIALFPDNLVAIVLASSTCRPDHRGLAVDATEWGTQGTAADAIGGSATVGLQRQRAHQFSDVLQQMATNLVWTSSPGRCVFQRAAKRDERRAGDAPAGLPGRQSEIDPPARTFKSKISLRG